MDRHERRQLGDALCVDWRQRSWIHQLGQRPPSLSAPWPEHIQRWGHFTFSSCFSVLVFPPFCILSGGVRAELNNKNYENLFGRPCKEIQHMKSLNLLVDVWLCPHGGRHYQIGRKLEGGRLLCKKRFHLQEECGWVQHKSGCHSQRSAFLIFAFCFFVCLPPLSLPVCATQILRSPYRPPPHPPRPFTNLATTRTSCSPRRWGGTRPGGSARQTTETWPASWTQSLRPSSPCRCTSTMSLRGLASTTMW